MGKSNRQQTRRRLVALVAAVLTVGVVGPATADNKVPSAAKVGICHRDFELGLAKKYELLTVSTAAVPAHLAHGDGFPGGAIPGTAGAVFTSKCVVNHVPVVGAQSFSIDENSLAATPVGTIVSSDPDVGDLLTLTVTGGTGTSAFAVSPAGAITVANASLLDYEVTTSFFLNVQVSDKYGATATAVITIMLNNLRDQPPVLSAQTFSIKENSLAGAAVGTIVFSDPDVGDVVTLTVTGGTGASAFNVNVTTGAVTVANSALLDFETTPSFTLNLNATDLLGNTASAVVTVNLIDDPSECITTDAQLRAAAAAGGTYCVDATAPVVLSGEVGVATTLVLNSTGPANATINANLVGRAFSVTGNLTLNNISVTNGRVQALGGAIRIITGSVTLAGTTEVKDSSAWLGGGVSVSDTFNNAGSTLIMRDLASVHDNLATSFGANVTVAAGGVYANQFGSVVMNDSSSITKNANDGDYSGGGMLINGANLTMNGSAAISQNSVPNGLGGGIYFVNGGSITMGVGARILGNSARNGGGIYRIDGNLGTITIGSVIVISNSPNNCAGPASVPNC
jgi:Cadherin domain